MTVIVRSGGVPVPGAQIFVLYPPGTARVEGGGYTRGAGEATDYVPLEAESVDVVVRIEGLGMNGWRFDVRDGAPIEIDLTAARGSLRIPYRLGRKVFVVRQVEGQQVKVPAAPLSVHGNSRLVTPGGAWIRMATLGGINNRGQIQNDGDELVVRALAPGTYSYCPEDGVCSAVDVVPWAESRVRE